MNEFLQVCLFNSDHCVTIVTNLFYNDLYVVLILFDIKIVEVNFFLFIITKCLQVPPNSELN
jgi:hypothetical protein